MEIITQMKNLLNANTNTSYLKYKAKCKYSCLAPIHTITLYWDQRPQSKSQIKHEKSSKSKVLKVTIS